MSKLDDLHIDTTQADHDAVMAIFVALDVKWWEAERIQQALASAYALGRQSFEKKPTLTDLSHAISFDPLTGKEVIPSGIIITSGVATPHVR
jgi:hypothetical protein